MIILTSQCVCHKYVLWVMKDHGTKGQSDDIKSVVHLEDQRNLILGLQFNNDKE